MFIILKNCQLSVVEYIKTGWADNAKQYYSNYLTFNLVFSYLYTNNITNGSITH